MTFNAMKELESLLEAMQDPDICPDLATQEATRIAGKRKRARWHHDR